jgi:putative ABC transport system ATP-binding protein
MQIAKGEYVSIAGPSGCGKSTLLSILGLLDTATEGRNFLNGRPVSDLSERARVRIWIGASIGIVWGDSAERTVRVRSRRRSSLLAPQRDHRIDAGGPAGWSHAGYGSDNG